MVVPAPMDLALSMRGSPAVPADCVAVNPFPLEVVALIEPVLIELAARMRTLFFIRCTSALDLHLNMAQSSSRNV